MLSLNIPYGFNCNYSPNLCHSGIADAIFTSLNSACKLVYKFSILDAYRNIVPPRGLVVYIDGVAFTGCEINHLFLFLIVISNG